MARQLVIHLFSEPIGLLTQDKGQLSFCYTRQWLENPEATPLSYSLRLQSHAFDDGSTRAFFAGLLPSEDERKCIAKCLKQSPLNVLALLGALGSDYAGAVSIHTAETEDTHSGDVFWLNKEDIKTLLSRQSITQESADAVRISVFNIARCINNIPVVLGDKTIGLPVRAMQSTHTLTIPINELNDQALNQLFCYELAKAFDLEVCPTEVRMFDELLVLLTQRSDYTPSVNGTLQRVHQENICQALGTPANNTRQSQGGPSYAKCFALVRALCNKPLEQTEKLLDAIIFCGLIGHNDFHTKNIAINYVGNAPQMAPLEHLICSGVYPSQHNSTAMKIGGRYKFSDLTLQQWEAFCIETGMSLALVKTRLAYFSEQLPAKAKLVRKQITDSFYASITIDKVVTHIEQQAMRTTLHLNQKSF
jgi:serine/threonine-protein kinase HipA